MKEITSDRHQAVPTPRDGANSPVIIGVLLPVGGIKTHLCVKKTIT